MNELDKIIEHKRTEVARRKTAAETVRLKEAVEKAADPRNFGRVLWGEGVSLIAEVKKASPSAGLIREAFDPVEIARSYEKGGAAALSVLTDEKFFQGSLENLALIRESIGLPLLQKDFIIDEFQLLEARAAGADAVLLIVAALDDASLRRLHDAAEALKLQVLVEVHNEPELRRALQLGAEIIGINNRDLTKMEVSLNTTAQLVPKIPTDRIIVSESGIKTSSDVQMLKMLGVDAILVGESLLKQPDVETAVKKLISGAKVLTD